MRIVTTHDTNHTPDQIWQVAAEQFASISEWSNGVKRSSLAGTPSVGAVRTCDLADGSTVTETITTFDPNAHTLTYLVDSGVPPVVRAVENAITIEDLGSGRSRITSVLTPEVKWWATPMTPIMKRQFGAMMSGLLSDLAAEVARQTADQAAS